MQISTKIDAFLKEKNVSNKEIAEELAVTASTISHYRNGKRQIPLDFLEWFINKYDPNLNDLFYGDSIRVVKENEAPYNRNINKTKLLKEIKEVVNKYVS